MAARIALRNASSAARRAARSANADIDAWISPWDRATCFAAFPACRAST
jgi:hypothetical protein